MLPVYLAIAAVFAAVSTCTTTAPHLWPPDSMPRREAFLQDVIEGPLVPAPIETCHVDCQSNESEG